jgi:hypothetical protein
MTLNVWSIDPPPPFASRAVWQTRCEVLRQLGTYNGSPALHAAIAEAEAILGGMPESETRNSSALNPN